jgi:hypothetical protein
MDTEQNININIVNNEMTKTISKEDNNLSALSIVVNKNSETTKYDVALSFVNKILTNIGEKNINKLDEFKNIDRNNIIKAENNFIVNDMKTILFAKNNFNKTNCGYYRKKSKNMCLNIIRGMCRELNLKLSHTKKNVQETKWCNKVHNLYSINVNDIDTINVKN